MTSPTLALTLLGPENATRSIVLLHGILGSGGNLRGLGRRLVGAVPATRVVLVDLRGHGESAEYARAQGGPHTVEACTLDLADALAQQSLACDALIGHSFGGKVALRYAERFPTALRQVWALDSTPGPGRDAGGGDVGHVFGCLRDVVAEQELPFKTREEMLASLKRRGLSLGLANWMTTNLRRTEEGYVFTFDLEIVGELLEDYFRVDMWPWLERRRGKPDVHLLRAERSDRFSPADIERALALPELARVKLHTLPGAGHWVHADNPDGLVEILAAELSAQLVG